MTEVYLLGGPLGDRHHDIRVPFGDYLPSHLIVQTVATGRVASLAPMRYVHSGEQTAEGVPVYRPG